MVNKRGYSYGPEYPIHFEERLDGWAVFDARDDRDIATGLKKWDAEKLCQSENGHPQPNLSDMDLTP